MNVFYDFEFLENGKIIDPISMGMYSENGNSIYWINSEFDWSTATDWLNLNVKPKLRRADDNAIICEKITAASLVKRFLDGCDNFNLWGYYSDYDHVALAQLYGTMMNWPFSKTMHTNDVKQLMNMFNIKRSDLPNNDNCHNALDDAKWTCLAYNTIKALVNDKKQINF